MWAAELLASRGARRVADIGCGRLRNLPPLLKWFTHVTLVETALQVSRIVSPVPKVPRVRLQLWEQFVSDDDTYDAIFLVSVLHILPWPKQRDKILDGVVARLRIGGFLLIDVPFAERYYRQHCTPGRRYSDGWAMGDGPVRTFYKNYSAGELDQAVLGARKLRLAAKYSVDKHFVRLWERLGA
jgi:SAM-dependent methyltransferase